MTMAGGTERQDDAGAHPGSGQAERYDRIADGYARWWGPVIAPAAVALLDHVEPAIAAGALSLLDVGTGTGTLAFAAIERWGHVRVTGIDASAEMIARASADADTRLAPTGRQRYDTVVAFADLLPFADSAFDVAMSSFVLQLVPSRARALREARRVVRPGGWMAWVSWLASDRRFAPDDIVDEVLGEAGFDPREPDPRPRDLASVGAATAAMRRAGFRDVRAEAGMLEHPWDADGYLGFLEHFDEESTFEELGPDRDRVRARLVERVSTLSADELTLRLPVVYVVGRVPG